MILSVDPSIRACGWAVVVRPPPGGAPRVVLSNTWRPSAAKGEACPLLQLARFVLFLADDYPPEAVIIETPDGGDRDYRDAAGGRHAVRGSRERAYAMAVGAVAGAAVAAVGTDAVHLVTVNEWKGTRTKAQTRPAAVTLLGREPVDDNESDAVCLAAAWLDGLPASRTKARRFGAGYVSDTYRRAVEGAIRR